ncbi:magnesium transporter CorA family protein [Methyloraptor flagellatus]|uniref:Magnesium transport protein CorA n=1 Tax=Methyloraptor flagellatus TaxID=3162530 RepID=A0AAU7X7S0_9HYPH
MLKSYACEADALREAAISPEAVWFDLIEPTPEEDRAVEAILGVSVPTREEQQEIEASSRLYDENGAVYMTVLLPIRTDKALPHTTPVTFILAQSRLCTVRYDEPRSIEIFAGRATKPGSGIDGGRAVLLGLLDVIIDRIADVLERIGGEIDEVSAAVFAAEINGGARGRDLGPNIKAIGRQGAAIGRIQESLVSLSRALLFLVEDRPDRDCGLTDHDRTHLATLGQDVRSLTEHAASMDAKVNFLLNATLGLVSLQQNQIVKIFSVLAVVFMPPTLIASIYGMNFHAMPELDLAWGYPMALMLMVASVAGTYGVFKYRGWL